jgi:ketosteroid isomerase-like protein
MMAVARRTRPDRPQDSEPTVSTADTRTVIERLYEAYRSGDGDQLLDVLDEDVVWEMPESLETSRLIGRIVVANELGSDIVRRRFVRGTFSLTVHRVLVDGDHAAVEQTIDAVTKEGSVYHMDYCWTYHVVDHKIAKMRIYLDTEHASAVLDH